MGCFIIKIVVKSKFFLLVLNWGISCFFQVVTPTKWCLCETHEAMPMWDPNNTAYMKPTQVVPMWDPQSGVYTSSSNSSGLYTLGTSLPLKILLMSPRNPSFRTWVTLKMNTIVFLFTATWKYNHFRSTTTNKQFQIATFSGINENYQNEYIIRLLHF